jgi:hypothetical protein
MKPLFGLGLAGYLCFPIRCAYNVCMETNTYLEIVHVGRGAKLHYAPRNSQVTCCGKWNAHESYSTTATVDCKKCIETVEELKRWNK